MLLENIISFFVDCACGLLGNIFDLEVLLDFIDAFYSVYDIFLEILSGALFFLPVDYLGPLFSLIFAVIGIRIVIAVVKFVLMFIPTMGG